MKDHKFTHTWSERFLKQRRKPLSVNTTNTWCDQLLLQAPQGWHRLVITAWWGTPFTHVSEADQVVDWVNHVCAHKAFIKLRGPHKISMGLQLWLSDPEDLVIMNLMQDIHMHRFMTPVHCVQDWTSCFRHLHKIY